MKGSKLRARLRAAGPVPPRLAVPDFVRDAGQLRAMASHPEGRDALCVFVDYLQQVQDVNVHNVAVAEEVLGAVNGALGRVVA